MFLLSMNFFRVYIWSKKWNNMRAYCLSDLMLTKCTSIIGTSELFRFIRSSHGIRNFSLPTWNELWNNNLKSSIESWTTFEVTIYLDDQQFSKSTIRVVEIQLPSRHICQSNFLFSVACILREEALKQWAKIYREYTTGAITKKRKKEKQQKGTPK